MFRQCLRQSSTKCLRWSHLSRTAAYRYASSSKPKGAQSRASRLTYIQKKLNRPAVVTARFLYNLPWRGTLRYSVGTFLFFHIFTAYFYAMNTCEGISMLPTINSDGDWVIISKYYRRGRGIEVGDLISFHHPVEQGVDSIKRVIGLEGDFVLRDTPGTTGKMIQVPQGHCWVVGDNLKWSRDSRLFGPIPLALIRGKVVLRYIPWTSFYKIDDGLQESDIDEDEV